MKLYRLDNDQTGEVKFVGAYDISEVSLIGWTSIRFLRMV